MLWLMFMLMQDWFSKNAIQTPRMFSLNCSWSLVTGQKKMHRIGTAKAKEAQNLYRSFTLILYLMKKCCSLLKLIKSMNLFIWESKFKVLNDCQGNRNSQFPCEKDSWDQREGPFDPLRLTFLIYCPAPSAPQRQLIASWITQVS